ENIDGRARLPVCWLGMKNLLDIGPVEIDLGLGVQVRKGSWVSERIAHEWAVGRNHVDVEARILLKSSPIISLAPQFITTAFRTHSKICSQRLHFCFFPMLGLFGSFPFGGKLIAFFK